MKASDRDRNVKSKEFFGCFDEFCISIFHFGSDAESGNLSELAEYPVVRKARKTNNVVMAPIAHGVIIRYDWK